MARPDSPACFLRQQGRRRRRSSVDQVDQLVEHRVDADQAPSACRRPVLLDEGGFDDFRNTRIRPEAEALSASALSGRRCWCSCLLPLLSALFTRIRPGAWFLGEVFDSDEVGDPLLGADVAASSPDEVENVPMASGIFSDSLPKESIRRLHGTGVRAGDFTQRQQVAQDGGRSMPFFRRRPSAPRCQVVHGLPPPQPPRIPWRYSWLPAAVLGCPR